MTMLAGALVLVIPVFIILSSRGIVQPLLSVGDADIQVHDLVLLIIASQVIASVMLRRRPLRGHGVYLAITLFLGTLLFATILAFYRFGEAVFIGELIAFLRFLSQVSVIVWMTELVRTTKQVSKMHKLLDLVGTLIAISVYLDVALYSSGTSVRVGEVQVTEKMVRYFGPVGDQIGFLLLFFIYRALVDRDWLRLVLFSGALILTGTRGPLITLAVGCIMLFRLRSGDKSFELNWSILLLLMTIVGLGIFWDVGGLQQRWMYPFDTLTQRLLTNKIALDVFLDNILTGVGYTGFRYLALEYGAVELFMEKYYFSPNFIAVAGMQWLQTATDGGLFALASFTWMSVVLLRTIRRAARYSGHQFRGFYLASYVWLISMLIGNLTAAWILPGSLISYFLWIMVGLAMSVNRLSVVKGQLQLNEPLGNGSTRPISGVGIQL